MPNYKNGKIYQIISPNCTEVYIGSTTQPLSVRMAQHRREAKKQIIRSYRIIEAGDSYIELIEEYPCENKEQLNKREGEIQRSRTCINHNIAGRTPDERYKETRDSILQRRVIRYEANKDKLIQIQLEYYNRNKDVINQKNRDRYQKKKLQASQASEQVKEN